MLADQQPDGRRTVVGIAGAPGAGKTVLATTLVARLVHDGVTSAHVPMDGFHLADVALDRLGRRDRKGAPDTFDPDGYAVLLERLGRGEHVWAPGFERDLDQPIAQSIEVRTDVRVVVTEGNYLLLDRPEWAAVRRQLTETWFCRVDEAQRVRQLVARHVRFGKSPAEAREWVERSDEANARLIAESADRADVRVDLRY